MSRRRSLFLTVVLATLAASSVVADDGTDPGDPERLLSDRLGWRDALGIHGLELDLSYTGDFIANTRGGNARKRDYLGTLDVTLAWDSDFLFDADLGTFFVYAFWNHGGQPSKSVGDIQATDNIEAPDSIRLFEAWWQRTLFDGRVSLLAGLYDVNSEFYAIDSAELFLNGSFGMGAELGNTGLSGPSTFPVAGLGARLKAEPVRGFEIQIAAVEGAPGDPRRPTATSLDLEDAEGAFLIAQVSLDRYSGSSNDEAEDVFRPSQRRRLGRVWADRPRWARVALGTWLYTARQPHVSRTNAMGEPIRARGHPGLYMTVDYEAEPVLLDSSTDVALFLQLGWADGDVGPFEGYVGGGATFIGLVPWRREDESGVAVAAAFAGDALQDAVRSEGREPATAEIAIEATHRVTIAEWLSIQGDVQYVVNPGAVRDRPDAIVVGLRWVLSL